MCFHVTKPPVLSEWFYNGFLQYKSWSPSEFPRSRKWFPFLGYYVSSKIFLLIKEITYEITHWGHLQMFGISWHSSLQAILEYFYKKNLIIIINSISTLICSQWNCNFLLIPEQYIYNDQCDKKNQIILQLIYKCQ